MARIRTIKPEFPQCEVVGSLSREARLLYILLWTVSDDDGRARAAPQVLAGQLYPFDADAASMIPGWLDELETQRQILRYRAGGSAYLAIVNWRTLQRIDKPTPSRLPPPPDGLLEGDFGEGSRETRDGSRWPREGSRPTLDLGPRNTAQEGTSITESEREKNSRRALVAI